MWLLVCFFGVQICFSYVTGEIISAPGGNGIKGKLLAQRSCFVTSPSSGDPLNLPDHPLNPRYRRAIQAAEGVPQNKNVENSGIPSEISQNTRSKVLAPSPQRLPPRNMGYYQPPKAAENGNPQQLPSRQLYPTYDGSFGQVSHQRQPPSWNQDTLSVHPSGRATCPYCNHPLPPDFGFQRQTLNRPNQYQSSENTSRNFHQQYPGQPRYDGYPEVKASPTVASEETCPYDSGSPTKPSPSLGYNLNLQQFPDFRDTSRDRYYSPANNPSPQPPVKNEQPVPPAQDAPARITKAGIPPHQAVKYIKTFRTESAMKK